MLSLPVSACTQAPAQPSQTFCRAWDGKAGLLPALFLQLKFQCAHDDCPKIAPICHSHGVGPRCESGVGIWAEETETSGYDAVMQHSSHHVP